LKNWQELQAGTNPNSAVDSDGDGMADDWENFYGLNPNLNDSTGDADGDGVSNINEYNLGRNPNAGVVNDTTNALGLKVYTRLEN
jgi:hypothetical protein